MYASLSLIKAVGFDLDRTLYTDTTEMNERVAQEIFKAILKFKPELETIERVRAIYTKKGEELRSWSRVLEEIGLENSGEVVKDCLDSADITDLIKDDRKLVQIMEQLSQKFFLFLITRSTRNHATKKLSRIGIPSGLFHFSSFGDDPHSLSERFGKNFKYFLSQSPYQPFEHVYIGDNPQTDIIPPKNLGMKTIIVGKYFKEADFSISNIHEIEHLLLS